MITVTTEQVTEAIKAIVAEYGRDYTYPRFEGAGSGCFYVKDGEPSCIVGKVLHRLGATIPALLKCDNEGRINDRVLAYVEIEMPPEARFALLSAQEVQDDRKTWGLALDAYLDELDREESFA